MGSAEYKLSQLELHGNRLQSLSHVAQCLSHCVNLRSLALAQAGSDNPVCQTPGKVLVFTCLSERFEEITIVTEK